jgi:hypothetical protein
MTLSVHINGVRQVPGIDYVAAKNSVSFSTPPAAGDTIHISSPRGTVAHIMADGSTYLYQMMMDIDRHDNIMNLLNDAAKYYDNPAVADLLERLQVVVELVKQDDPIRQR